MLFKILRKIEEFLISTSVMIVALLTVVNVFTRTFLGESLTFAEELTQFLMILITFVGTSYAAGCARHIRMSAIYDMFGLKGRKALLLLTSSVTCLLMFALTYYAISYAGTLKTLATESPVLGVPYFYVYSVVPVGFFLTGVQYAMTFYKNLTSASVYLSYVDEDPYFIKRVPAQGDYEDSKGGA